jgi:hypothetical protein
MAREKQPLRPHELQALRFLSRGPDRIRVIDDENTFAAALVYAELSRRGLVHIDADDAAVITISSEGLAALPDAA